MGQADGSTWDPAGNAGAAGGWMWWGVFKNRPALFFFPRTQLSLVALVDLCQQSGVYSVSSRESLSFRILKTVGKKVASGTGQQNEQASKSGT